MKHQTGNFWMVLNHHWGKGVLCEFVWWDVLTIDLVELRCVSKRRANCLVGMLIGPRKGPVGGGWGAVFLLVSL